MNRALVIKTYGDPETCGAIVDGMTRRVIPLNEGELAAIKAECARLKAQNEIRAYGDSVRYETACKALAAKYPPEHHGRLYNVMLVLWAGLWLAIYNIYDYLSAWNREP